LVVWTGVTFWGSYLSAQHIDYWRAHFSNQVLELKVRYLVNQLDKTRSFLDEVKQIEAKLREMLEYKNKQSLISTEAALKLPSGRGGPSHLDEREVSQLLRQEGTNLSWERLVEKVNLMKNEAQIRIASYEDLSSWVGHQRHLYQSTPRGWPSPGRLSSHFGRRVDPFTGTLDNHYGVDISGPEGTPVRATADGTIKMSSWHSGYGKLVVIQHNFGYCTRYAHNGRLLVKVGDEVKRGQVIALMGNTGKSSGPHCHYEVWQYSKRLNPFAYLKTTSSKEAKTSDSFPKKQATRES